jgi:hypothetical protein
MCIDKQTTLMETLNQNYLLLNYLMRGPFLYKLYDTKRRNSQLVRKNSQRH